LPINRLRSGVGVPSGSSKQPIKENNGRTNKNIFFILRLCIPCNIKKALEFYVKGFQFKNLFFL